MHAVLPFAIAQGLVEVPFIIVQAAAYCLITYWMVYFEVSAGELPAGHLHSAFWRGRKFSARAPDVTYSSSCAAGKFFWYFMVETLTLCYFSMYGFLAVALSPTVQMAAVCSSAFFSLW